MKRQVRRRRLNEQRRTPSHAAACVVVQAGDARCHGCDQASRIKPPCRRVAVKIVPVNPKNFLFDPNGTSIDDCMGVAIEKYVSIHKVVEGIERGIYRKVDITPTYEDT